MSQNDTVKIAKFDNFSEYQRYMNVLTSCQQKVIFKTFSKEEKKRIDKERNFDKNREFLQRLEIDNKLKRFKEETGYDILKMKNDILQGKGKYIPKKYWEDILSRLFNYPWKLKYFAIGGISVEKENEDVFFLTKK